MGLPEDGLKRRPIATRETAWAKAVAARLAAAGVAPNTISFGSALFAAVAGGALWAAGRTSGVAAIALLLAAAAGMQLRLLCNLFDGMVAIEGGRKSKSGEIWNELPDRFADLFVFVPAGYGLDPGAWSAFGASASWGPALGWSCGALALLTAYVRTLGSSAGAAPDFRGPMAKQQRMAVMTVACVAGAVEAGVGAAPRALAIALVLVALGALLTVVRRTRRVARELEAR